MLSFVMKVTSWLYYLCCLSSVPALLRVGDSLAIPGAVESNISKVFTCFVNERQQLRKEEQDGMALLD